MGRGLNTVPTASLGAWALRCGPLPCADRQTHVQHTFFKFGEEVFYSQYEIRANAAELRTIRHSILNHYQFTEEERVVTPESNVTSCSVSFRVCLSRTHNSPSNKASPTNNKISQVVVVLFVGCEGAPSGGRAPRTVSNCIVPCKRIQYRHSVQL